MRHSKFVAALFALFTLTACSETITSINLNEPSFDRFRGSHRELARQVLTMLQPPSTAQNLEYCGFIVERSDGSLYITGPYVGTDVSCSFPYPEFEEGYQKGDEAVADYHTHSAYGPTLDSEVPSSTDMISNKVSAIPGYVSTPGGRFWLVESDGELARQLCGIGCLPQDPNFVEDTFVPNRLTLEDVARREGRKIY